MIVSKDIPENLYRKGVGIVLFNNDKEIFVGKRIKNRSNLWQMPQGGIEPNEDEVKAAFRELKEETGIENCEFIAKSLKYYYYNLPYSLQKKFWHGKFIGQKQRWFLFKYKGNQKDIDLQYDRAEFSQYKWVTVETLFKSVVEFKKNMYKEIIEEFKEFL